MSLKNRYDFENLENEAERLVLDAMERRLAATEGICQCEECVLDMACLALNNLKPHYRVSLMGKLYANSAVHTDYAAEVEKAVAQAVEKISKNPAHD